MTARSQVRVDVTALVVGDPGWTAQWTDGCIEIRTARPNGSQAIEPGVHLVLDEVAFEALFAAMERAAIRHPCYDRTPRLAG